MQFVPGGSIANLLARFGSLEEEVPEVPKKKYEHFWAGQIVHLGNQKLRYRI